jgi:cytochrome P450
MSTLVETEGAQGITSKPPGPPRSATFAMLRQLLGDRLGLMSNAAAGYGDAVLMAIGPKRLYFFNHPDHARYVLAENSANYHKGIGLAQAKRALGDGLLTSEGELWRTQRKAVQPAFQAKRISRQAATIAEESAKLVDRLRGHIGSGPLNISGEVTDLSLGVLGRSLLDCDLSGFTSLGKDFEHVQDQAMFEMVTLGMVPTWLPLPKQIRFRRGRRNLERVIDTLIAERDATPSAAGDDALTKLIESTRAEPNTARGQQRMRDELITLLLAGHETTASTLSWALYLIDRHPEVRERLHEEAVRVLGDRRPAYEDLRGLVYTSMVIEESMRLYPPVWMLSRIAQENDVIGGYRIPSGADVLICPYTLHRHPGYWPEPDKFDPERFNPATSHQRPRYAYIPFGAGPRFCVGNHLGMMEAVFTLAMISRELRLTAAPGSRAEPEAMLSLRIRGGLTMSVHDAN